MSVRRNRAILKRVFLDEVEDNLLKLNMKKFGMIKFSTYARRMLLYPKTPIIKIDTDSIQLLRFELNKIGNNINQLAKVAHQTHVVSATVIEELGKQVLLLEKKLAQDFQIKIQEVEKQTW